MNAWIRGSRTGRPLLAAALFCALFLRVLIPTGYMPTAGEGGLAVSLCSGSQGESVTLDLGSQAPDRAHQTAGDLCAFACGLGSALLGAAELLVPQSILYGLAMAGSAAMADLTVHGLAAPPPPSQAPPQLR